MHKRIGYEEMHRLGVHAYDATGERIGRVRAARVTEAGLEVWILAAAATRDQVAGLDGFGELAEFYAHIAGGYLRSGPCPSKD